MERCLGCMNEIDAAYDVCPHCGYVKGTGEQSKNHLSPGTVLIDRYLIGRCLGQGGFGITYIAWDQRLYKKVAIKEFMPVSLASRITGQMDITCYNEEAQARFQNGIRRMLDESRRLARFNDLEGVVKVYDCFEANQTAYIIMELLDGENIKTILTQQGTMDLAQTVRIILPVLQALREIHASGLIHRDISPDNIFVCKNGKVKLLDFGSARVATGTDEKSLSVILKPGYAPQEQYAKSAPQGPFTDVYAVGATIYKMLTGITPIDSLERRVQDDELAPIETLVDVPPHVAEVIGKGLAVDAKSRLQTVDPLLETLQRLEGAESVPLPDVQPPKANKSKPAAPGKKSGKPKGKKILTACLAVLIVGAAGFAGWYYIRRTPVPPDKTTVSNPLSAEEEELLGEAKTGQTPLELLPQPDNRETLRMQYADRMTYVPQDGGLYADYTDADGRLCLHEHILLPSLADGRSAKETDRFTLYTYTDDGQPEAVVQYLADGSVVTAERYLYKSDGALFAVSSYEGDRLATYREYVSYDDDGRPKEYVLHYNGDKADEYGTYIYNNTVEIEKRTGSDGKNVYKRTCHLENKTVTELWYEDGETPREVKVKNNADDNPVERVVNSYGAQTEKCTWKYDADGNLTKHTLLDKDNKQSAAVTCKYEEGSLRYIITEKGSGRKDCQLDLTSGEYALFAYDEKGNETLREKYSEDDELIARTGMAYDDEDLLSRVEFYDENGELDHYRDQYHYYPDYENIGEAVEYTEYDARDKKLFTLLKAGTLTEKTEYDEQERETYFCKQDGERFINKRITEYSGNGSKEETLFRYDETGDMTGKTVDTYRDGDLVQEEQYDRTDSLRLRRVFSSPNHPSDLYLYENNKLTAHYARENNLLGDRVWHYNGNDRLVEQIRSGEMDWYQFDLLS